MKLSVSLTSYRERASEPFLRMFDRLCRQAENHPVEILALLDNRARSTGSKLQACSDFANGAYLCEVGDDDEIADDYIARILEAIDSGDGVDCVTFDVDYSENGRHVARVVESIHNVPEYTHQKGPVWRYPVSPKSAIRRDLRRLFRYPDMWYSEDLVFARMMTPVLRTETHIDAPLYRCLYVPDKPFSSSYKIGRNREGYPWPQGGHYGIPGAFR